MTTTPIRIGFIGLSVGNVASSAWAKTAHWPYLSSTNKFTITALCNSSVSSAQNAKAHYKLPAATKCYDNPAKLAADADVDLVVCSVRVDKHYALVKPALEAGKSVYCEWPLGANVQEAEELAAIARKNGVKTMVGLQARQSPLIAKIKEMLDAGRIGRVLSSTVVTAVSQGGPTESADMDYSIDRKIGGNVMTIHFGHTIDWIVSVLGELDSLSGLVSIQRPQIDLVRDGKTVKTATKDTPDQIMVQGQLKSGGVLSVHLRGGKKFKDEPAYQWHIYGEKGEIRIVSPGPFVNFYDPNVTIRVHDQEKDTVEEVAWDEPSLVSGLPSPAQNVARMYEAWAAGGSVPDFEAALRRHKMLDAVRASSDKGSRVSYV